jgi:hypothetical protein
MQVVKYKHFQMNVQKFSASGKFVYQAVYTRVLLLEHRSTNYSKANVPIKAIYQICDLYSLIHVVCIL